MDQSYPFFHYVNSPYYPQWYAYPSNLPFYPYLQYDHQDMQGSCETDNGSKATVVNEKG